MLQESNRAKSDNLIIGYSVTITWRFTMETTITVTQLSRRLSDILNRVKYKGESFKVQRNGEVIATLSPATSAPGITVQELIARVGNLPLPGEGFADDLEAIQAAQGVAEMPEWPD
jgi:antitoxin (DNA-binding transcriptional repressor) of toxin-antitoxin stability system